jgi:hypothetical protein
VNVQLKGLVKCEAPNCELTTEVEVDLGDLSIDLHSRSLNINNVTLPQHWEKSGLGIRCPMCYLRNV